MRGCLGCIWAPIAAIIAVLCWILGWLSWAIFKLIFICLWCFGLVVWCFASYPPAPANVDAGYSTGVISRALVEAAQRGDVGSQYALAQAFQHIAEKEDMLNAAVSTMADVPEELLVSDDARKAGEQAEYWYGKVADQGYMLARIELWKMTTARWERSIELWCMLGQHLNDDD